MRPSEAVRRGADYLERHDVDASLSTAEQLLAGVLGTDRSGVYAREEPLRNAEARSYGRALCRRCTGVPTQHLTGETGFRHLVLTVRPGVFVPRPETEIVVDAAVEALPVTPGPLVVDVGTGAGAIALSLKRERPDARVIAVDRSPEALALTEENAARTGLEIEVRASDLLTALDPSSTVPIDLVVSNPPYVEEGEYAALPAEVRADPVEALVGGVEVYATLFEQASTRLREGGVVVVEIGERQAAAVGEKAREAGAADVVVLPDLAGRDRVIVATWP
ncbi:MAG TPA: peptide chain release factor N(5)-glutamine methyltransferase [Actinomycetota bacterium]|nr:peptide chain release factor N(5)-glutamine methyltransferase [Actinomycetota bacterium]